MGREVPGQVTGRGKERRGVISGRGGNLSGDVIQLVALLGQQVLDPFQVVPLEFDGGALDGAAAGELPLQEFGQFIQVDINGIEAIDDGDLLPIPPSVDLDSDSLLFLGNFFTDAEFLWQSARWTDPTIHYS
jgi:hypothetical protein